MDIYAAGAIAAFTVDLLVYPLDTLKTRYQSQDYLSTYGAKARSKPLALRGLYQGVGSVILATLPAAGLFFSTYEKAKDVLSATLPLSQPLVHSAASGVAEMASCLALAPAEVIKQNAQMLKSQTGSDNRGSTSLRAFRQLARGGASRRLFTGYTALVARNLPFTALQFPMFEAIRAQLWESRTGSRRGHDDAYRRGLLETGLITGASAGSAGALAAFVTTPSDVVKTRMMVTAGERESRTSGGEVKKTAGAWSVTKAVYNERGVRGLFRGGLFRSGWTAIGSGLYLGTYEVAKTWLRRDKPGLGDEGPL